METTVLIVDDFPLVRQGIAAALAADPSLRVVGEVGSAAEALESIRALEPDVVLLDLRLPDGGGPELIRALLAEVASSRVLVLTAIEKVGMIRELRDAGAVGCITKRTPPRDIRGAILTVRGGGTAFDLVEPDDAPGDRPGISPQEAADTKDLLTARQLQILKLIAEGAPDLEVARRLSISPRTVQNHLAAIRAKTGLTRRSQLANWATKHTS